MKKTCWIFVNLLIAISAFGQASPVQPNVARLTIDFGSVTVLHLRPGYVSSVRLPEEVSSVVVGDPKAFKAEHSEAEPRLVFLKPLLSKPSRTNALITTQSGHEVPVELVSTGQVDGGEVDFLLDYERPHTFLVDSPNSSFLVSETVPVSTVLSRDAQEEDPAQRELLRQARVVVPDLRGEPLQLAVGQVGRSGAHTIVPFSVINHSKSAIELLPPQIELSASAKHGDKMKAEPIPINTYVLPLRRVPAGARVDGIVVFDRPVFKESTEQLFLQIANAAQVDHPVFSPIPFTSPSEGDRNK